MVDKNSTHGTFVNGTKLTPEQPHKLSNTDHIRLGCPLETTSTVAQAEHLPTELEVGILAMHGAPPFIPPGSTSQRDLHDPAHPNTSKVATNSFHAPDDDDEDDEADEAASRTTTTGFWRPFGNPSAEWLARTETPGPHYPVEGIAEQANQRSLSSGGNVLPPVVVSHDAAAAATSKNLWMGDLNPWTVASEPIREHSPLELYQPKLSLFDDNNDDDDDDDEERSYYSDDSYEQHHEYNEWRPAGLSYNAQEPASLKTENNANPPSSSQVPEPSLPTVPSFIPDHSPSQVPSLPPSPLSPFPAPD